MKLEKVREKLCQIKLRLTRLEYKINTLKGQKQTPKLCVTQDILATQNISIISSGMKPLKEKELTNLTLKNYAQMAALDLPKITTKKIWTKVTSSSQRQKATTSSTRKVELEKKR